MIKDLLNAIHQWGVDRNIIGDGTSQAQFLKLLEEFSEYAEATNEEQIRDGIGDSVVVLVMIAGIEKFELRLLDDPDNYPIAFNWPGAVVLFGNLAKAISHKNSVAIVQSSSAVFSYLFSLAGSNERYFTRCIQEAYDEIKDRKGVLLDGIFIRSTDTEAYANAMSRLGRSLDSD